MGIHVACKFFYFFYCFYSRKELFFSMLCCLFCKELGVFRLDCFLMLFFILFYCSLSLDALHYYLELISYDIFYWNVLCGDVKYFQFWWMVSPLISINFWVYLKNIILHSKVLCTIKFLLAHLETLKYPWLN